MIAWAKVEGVVSGRAGWRRSGREWRGPCPRCGGHDRAHLQPGDSVEVLGGCRRCGATGIEVARELVGEPFVPAYPRAPRLLVRPAHNSQGGAGGLFHPHRCAARTGDSERPGRVWSSAGAVSGSPGAVYLASRGVWPGSEHPAVRWLPADRAHLYGLYPRLPSGAAGCLCYRFAAPGEAGTFGVQVEAVDDMGRRVEFGRAGKRPSVAGSQFDHGRRVFEARAVAEGRCALVEGPIDALAVAHLLPSAGVRGAAGTSGFTAPAVAGVEIVEIAADRDAAGETAAVRLGAILEANGRRWRIFRPASAGDWGEVLELRAEREALRDG